MLKNYFLITYRNLKRQNYNIYINILGMATGMASFLFIAFYILDEYSFDRFHQQREKIFRITSFIKFGETEADLAITSSAMAHAIKEDIPEVDNVVRLDILTGYNLKIKDQIFSKHSIIAADEDFFSLFSFELKEGNPETSLKEPQSLILTESYSRKVFNSIDVVDFTVELNNKPYKITGIVEDCPRNSHFQFDMIISYSSLSKANNMTAWGEFNTYTYVSLIDESKLKVVEEKLNSDRYATLIPPNIYYKRSMQKLTDIHLHSNLVREINVNGDVQYVYIFSFIGLFIIILACINFMNLSTAKSLVRAKEVGIRKVLGSDRWSLISQFIMESVLLILISVAVSFLLIDAFKGPFFSITGKQISLYDLMTPQFFLIIFSLIVFTTFIAAIYPAFYLSRFQPSVVLKGTFRNSGEGIAVRNALVVFQFVVSAALILATMVINKQMNFISSKKLGIDKDNLMIIENGNQLGEQFHSFQNSIQDIPSILSVSSSESTPFEGYQGSSFKVEKDNEGMLITFTEVDHNYFQTLNINILEGRTFDHQLASDSNAIVINNAAKMKLGIDEALGQTLISGTRQYHIVGVTDDFHFESLHKEIKPLIFMYSNEKKPYLIARINGSKLPHAINSLEAKWKEFAGGHPFEYSFADESFDRLFKSEQKMAKIFRTFTIISLLIACLGLFSLANFLAEQKTKEIAIRKTLGASASQVVSLFSFHILKLVLIALLIALPVSYYLMKGWLEEFAYKTDIGPEVFLVSGLITIFIALLTISYESLKTSMIDPIKNLRSE
jgi:putative ABC transport system permease protein